jgi:transcriptional regulator with XRE-family HTH domain
MYIVFMTRNNRTTNTELLKELLRQKEDGQAYMAIETGLAPSTVIRIVSGGHVPGRQVRKLICLYFKVEENRLFPFLVKMDEAA